MSYRSIAESMEVVRGLRGLFRVQDGSLLVPSGWKEDDGGATLVLRLNKAWMDRIQPIYGSTPRVPEEVGNALDQALHDLLRVLLFIDGDHVVLDGVPLDMTKGKITGGIG